MTKEGNLAKLSLLLGIKIEGFTVDRGKLGNNKYYVQVHLSDRVYKVALGKIEGITQQTKFQRSLLDQVGVWPTRLDRHLWNTVLETIMEVLEPEPINEVLNGSNVKVWIAHYIKDNPPKSLSETFGKSVAGYEPVSIDNNIYINTVSFHTYVASTLKEKISLVSLGKLLAEHGFDKRRFQSGGLDAIYRLVPKDYLNEYLAAVQERPSRDRR